MELLQSAQNRVIRELNVEELAQEANERTLFQRQQRSQRGVKYYLNLGRGFVRSRWDWLNRLWRRTQDELILAEFEEGNQKNQQEVSLLRKFVEGCQPSGRVMASLPFYYKQLFTGKQRVTRGMLSHFDQELAEAQSAISKISSRQGGGLLVIGEALSGKSFFSDYIAETLAEGQVIRVQAPLEGSISPKDFYQAFRRQIKGRGTLLQLIQSMPPGTIFVLDDLELWWERSTEGLVVMKQLFELIENLGKEYIFLANCNVHFYYLLCQYTQIDIYFSSTICLSPFSSEALKQTILDRHASGRFSYSLEGTPSMEISPRDEDLFFTRILTISKGNIGFALRLWLRQIQEINGDDLLLTMIREQKMPLIPNSDWLVLLAQFVLHKRLSIKQLVRIFEGETYDSIQDIFYPLLQIGLIHSVSRYVYEIDPFIQPFIVRQLQKSKMI